MRDDLSGCLAIGVIVIITFVIGAICGAAIASESHRDAAVKAGVARYEVDPRTGDVKFVYTTKP